ncbi:AGAP012000-PA-like protein [Anopheles sinensis]|uniref:AGAP012000-PA-like protein n=1 Tax=Anopheles sinensis TaxID=74873 RepID=A0A084WK33_ANOSI|nr:AGAP012000-PA-like protein [Anopheles sinensis]
MENEMVRNITNTLAAIQNELQQIRVNSIPTSCTSGSFKETNAYYIRPYGYKENSFLVLCDFENYFNLGGGWTVFQRRMDGSVDFYRDWESYKNGFGDIDGEHWLGLEKLHLMTRSGRHELLVLLKDFEENLAYALYDDFKIGSETEKYNLTVGNYSGTAGDKLTHHNGMKFTTSDQDNNPRDGRENCAISYKGAWWFQRCYDR